MDSDPAGIIASALIGTCAVGGVGCVIASGIVWERSARAPMLLMVGLLAIAGGAIGLAIRPPQGNVFLRVVYAAAALACLIASLQTAGQLRRRR